MNGMSLTGIHVRRATLDDVGKLTELWRTMQFPVDDLARRITEFQIAVGEDGNILGALGLHVSGKQGFIHSEGFADFGLSDDLRPALIDRLNAVAKSHGLMRIWTQETAPFYRHRGLERADRETLAILPQALRDQPGEWLTLKLRDEIDTLISAERHFELLMAVQKEKGQRAVSNSKAIKTAARTFAVIICLLMIGAMIYLAQKGALFHRP